MDAQKDHTVQLSNLSDFEKFAKNKLDSNAWGYYSCGADEEQTLRENIEAFKRYLLRPRYLRDVSAVDMKTSVLGCVVDFPVGIAPTGSHKMAHKDGEEATARASAKMNTVMGLSIWCNTSLEDVARANGSGLRWLQISIFRNRELTESLIHRAEKAGYNAIVVTVDQPNVGQRAYGTFVPPLNISFPNLGDVPTPLMVEDVSSLLDPSHTWSDIDWVRGLTQLPIVLKGILTAEDAIEAVKHDVQGLIVSNHGGRQLDGVLATLDALSEVVEAVGDKVEIYMDGGVRKGTDVLKALALGARAVFIGRPILWGLTYNGEDGVQDVLQIIKNELKLAMCLSGQTFTILALTVGQHFGTSRGYVYAQILNKGSTASIKKEQLLTYGTIMIKAVVSEFIDRSQVNVAIKNL